MKNSPLQIVVESLMLVGILLLANTFLSANGKVLLLTPMMVFTLFLLLGWLLRLGYIVGSKIKKRCVPILFLNSIFIGLGVLSVNVAWLYALHLLLSSLAWLLGFGLTNFLDDEL